MEGLKINLSLFGEETSAPAQVAEGQKAEKAVPVVYGKQVQPTEEPVAEVQDAKPSFKDLIEGEYKEDFTKFFQEKFNERHKEHKTLEAKVGELEGVLQVVAEKYGITELDAKKVLKAIEEDETYYEHEALERGMTTEQVRDFKRIEREKNELLREKQAREKEEKAAEIKTRWQTEEAALRTVYPQFDFAKEAQNPKFVGLVTNNIDLRTAYEVVHREELMNNTIQTTAKVVNKAVRQDIIARGSRPLEEGVNGSPAAVIKSDPRTWTLEDFAEVRRKVARGDKIKL